MGTVAMIVRKPPYGDINAAEAVRHALGAVSGELKASLVLVDGGVLLAARGQEEAATGFTNLESALRGCIDMGIEVFADRLSLAEQRIKQEDLVENIRVVDDSGIASILKEADATMIF